jgi:DNA-binding LytR/AlgR family response regulator
MRQLAQNGFTISFLLKNLHIFIGYLMSQNKEYSILIVEDELLIADHISRILNTAGFRNNRIVINVDEAIEAIQTQKPDIVLTDILLSGAKTGIDLGILLHTHYKMPFVYITSHSGSDMLSKAKHTHPNAYLVKPFKKEDLIVAIELALFNSELSTKSAEDAHLIIKDGHAMAQIPYADILWMEAEGNYTQLFTSNNKRRLVRTVITELHQQLPAHDFLRIHRSYVINKNYVTEYKSSLIHIKETKLPVGRTYKELLDEQFKNSK